MAICQVKDCINRLFLWTTRFSGGGGADLIVGNQAAGSALAGDAGHDTMYGGAFDDVFTGGVGDDLMLSGGGTDRYVFAPGWGHDVIGGWAVGARLDLRGSWLAFADLAIAVGPGFTLVTHGADSIQVYGAAGLTAAEFLFG